MVIRTSCGQHYSVVETNDPALDHVWAGIAVKRVKGVWTHKAKARIELVRKAASELVEASP